MLYDRDRHATCQLVAGMPANAHIRQWQRLIRSSKGFVACLSCDTGRVSDGVFPARVSEHRAISSLLGGWGECNVGAAMVRLCRGTSSVWARSVPPRTGGGSSRLGAAVTGAAARLVVATRQHTGVPLPTGNALETCRFGCRLSELNIYTPLDRLGGRAEIPCRGQRGGTTTHKTTPAAARQCACPSLD